MTTFDPRSLRRVVLRMVLADGRVSASEITRVRWVLRRALGEDPGEAAVRSELDELQGQPVQLWAWLQARRESLDDAACSRLLRAAYFIATADGSVVAAEDALLRALAQALSIPAERYARMLHPLVVAREIDEG